MSVLRKIGLTAVLVFVALLAIFVYWNSHLYYRAMREEDLKVRIKNLERSNRFAPLNDLVFYELGKAYFDRGMENLADAGAAMEYFQKSVESLKRSMAINPASPFAHYYLGQSLLHLNFFSPGKEADFLREFQRAAELAGENDEVFEEVGKVFFSRWLRLNEAEREFTLEILRKILSRGDEEKLDLFLSIWELNISDCEIMEKVLPRTPEAYRQFAGYLGEKSLFLEDRKRLLAEAERLEFSRAGREVELGETALFNLKTPEARGLLERALDRLRGIRFYQALRAENLISQAEFNELKKRTLLNLIKCRVEELAMRAGRAGAVGGQGKITLGDTGAGEPGPGPGPSTLGEIEPWIRQYLALEDQPREVGSLEEYLRLRGIFPERFSPSFDALDRLGLELLFQYKQNRYRDIINVGRMLGESIVVIPEGKKKDYVAILRLIGDSYQKIDYLYDAGDTYRRALDVDPADLETLCRLKNNYDRLSDERRLRELDLAIGKIVTPSSVDFKARRIGKGGVFGQKLRLAGEKMVLTLRLEREKKSLVPLISVFWNGRVVWEDYLREETLRLDLETAEGENRLEIGPVNAPVFLLRMSWSVQDSGAR